MQKEEEPDELGAFVRDIPQIVPQRWCLECRICCRFPDAEGVQSPTWSKREARWLSQNASPPAWLEDRPGSPSLHPRLERCGRNCHCPAFSHEANRCTIYPDRPLDCRLYPFVLARHPAGSVVLAMDLKCPYLEAHGSDPEVSRYAQRLARYLDSPVGGRYLLENPAAAGAHWPEFASVAALPSLSAPAEIKSHVPFVLKPLTPREWPFVQRFFEQEVHRYSGCTLASLWGWSDLIRPWWTVIGESLCVVCEQAGGFFMPFPPLGGSLEEGVLKRAWQLLEELNSGCGVSRIEGWEPHQREAAQSLGFTWEPAEGEYLYRTEEVAALRGNRFRSQRWAVNRCRRAVDGELRPFEERDLTPCLQLYTRWAIQRQKAHSEERDVKALARDGLFLHRRLMMDHQPLGLMGRVFEADGKILGYTFGAPVSPDLFGVFLEIADRSVPGLAQRLSQEFCRQIQEAGYPWINAMGDGGLAGLRQAKQSYRPAEVLPLYIATRAD